MKAKKLLALILAASMSVAALAGCGGSAGSDGESGQESATAGTETDGEAQGTDGAATEDGAEADTVISGTEELSFTYLIDQVDMGQEGKLYEEYEDGPVQKWWMSQAWDVDGQKKQISIDFTAPVAGAERDNYNTLMGTGEYPDIMSMSYAADTILSLYEEGVVLDLTDLINQYMPNYKAWIDSHPELESALYTTVDGEKKLLSINQVVDQPGEHWGGYMYRRDWIVDYGTNPETGEPFTGGYAEDGTWTDDVVFPSGETDPYYISDWEWMFEIFDKAQADLGITDGYNFQIHFSGMLATGDFVSSFGGIIPDYYLDKDGNVAYGLVSDGMRAYVECMANWYAKGWVDPAFEERTQDVFFMIDSTSIYAGKVGSWYGYTAELSNLLRDESNPAAANMYVAAAPQPINDVYGDKSVQNVMPGGYFGTGNLIEGNTVITNKAEDKDLPALLTAFDYLYSEEGAMVRRWGFSKEMQAELQDEMYNGHALADGAWWKETNADGEEIYVVNSTGINDSAVGMLGSSGMERMTGMTLNGNVVMNDRTESEQHQYDMWALHDATATGTIDSQIMAKLPTDVAEQKQMTANTISTYSNQMIPAFITGREKLDDASWQAFVDEVTSYGYEDYIDDIEELLK